MDDVRDFISDLKGTETYDAKQIDFAYEAGEKAYESAEASKSRNHELGEEALELIGQHLQKLASMENRHLVENREQLIPKNERFWTLLRELERPKFKSSRMDPTDLPRDSASAPFFFMDIMQPTADGNAIALTTSFPAFAHALCRPIIWADVLKPMVEWVLNIKHGGRFGRSAETILGRVLRRELGGIGDETVDHFSVSAKGFANRYWRWFKYTFWPFVDATEFYSESDPIYGEPIDKEDMVFVFSTTSGLLIPEEHFGRNVPGRLGWLRETTAAKNPARLGYFAQGILSSRRKIPVSYMWDVGNTKHTFRGNYQKAPDKKSKKLYRKEAERILSKAMVSNNLRIAQMKFERIGGWYLDPRAYLTLTSKRYAIWSWRPPQKGDVHIGHGLKVDGEAFGKILKLQAASAGIAVLSANNYLLSAILAAVAFVPEKGLSEPVARAARSLQHRLVKRLFDDGAERKVIKDTKGLGRKDATARARDMVGNYLEGLD